MHYSQMKRTVGSFIIILFITITVLILFILKEKNIFDERYSYYFITKSATSFTVGMPLKFSGFDVGIIDKMELQDDGTVKMTFSVNSKHKKWITQNSSLTMKKPLIGLPHINIKTPINSQPLPVNFSLPINIKDDINDLIEKLEPVVKKLKLIVDNVETITDKFASKDSDFMMILKNLNLFTQRLVENDSLLTTLIGDNNATKSLITSLHKTKSIMTQLDNIMLSINHKIINPSSLVINQLNRILKDVKKKLKIIEGTVNEVGGYKKDLKVIKEEVFLGIEKSNRIINKLDFFLESNSYKEVELP